MPYIYYYGLYEAGWIVSGFFSTHILLLLGRLSKVLWTMTPRENYHPNNIRMR